MKHKRRRDNKKVLLGNYNEAMTEQIEILFSFFAVSVDVVQTGDELLDKVKCEYPYDLIITNNLYKDGILNTGLMVLHALRAIPGFSTPVIVHTIETNQREFFIDVLGFDDYIEKPITLSELERINKKFLK